MSFWFLRSRYTAAMKILIYVLLAAIVVSLGTGLFYLRREDADSPKMLRALQIRVALSLTLVIVLVAAYFFGWINPPTR
jgi:NADH:ubiquinone oxidoreductase subunit 4 (subunit M)